MKADSVDLTFTDEAVTEIARISAEVNRTVENIGARRLHTVVERVMEELSFDAADFEEGATFEVTGEYVREKSAEYLKAADLARYII